MSTKAKIMIVEDDIVFAESLGRILANMGYRVAGTVRLGEEVVEQVTAERPDLILMDISLPGGIDGIKAAELVHDRYNIPVIFLTANENDETFQRAMLADPFAYLLKPLDSSRLYFSIEVALIKHKLEERIRESESRYRTIFDASCPAMIVSDENTTIAMVNEEFTKLSGFSKEEVENKKSWTEFFVGNELHEIDTYQRSGDKDMGRIPSSYAATFIDRAGCAKTVYTNVKMIPNTRTSIVSIVDITSLRQAEEENIKLNSALIRVNEDLMREIAERKRFEIELKHQASHDSLTSLPNRDLFFDRLTQAIAFEKRHNNYLALMLLDLDDFKKINDTQGHQAGDMLLKEVAKRLQLCMRQCDTVARFGGDEFVIIVNDMKYIRDIVKFAEKVTGLFRQPFEIFGKSISMTVSIGLSVYPLQSSTVNGLVKTADMAMYQAKGKGKNSFMFFSETMEFKTDEYSGLKEQLRHALEKEEFVPHYQPRVNAASGKITGMEALMRWQPLGAPLVYPADFFSLLEESGLIIPVGERLMYKVCQQTKAWQDAGLLPLRVAVKASPAQFRQENFPEMVAEILAATGLEPRYLEIEVSETIIMEDVATSITKLRKLKEVGTTITIDNFGTGYFSVGNLTMLPIDELKIDRSYVNGITSDPNRATVITATIAMGHSLGKMIVAEGVESKDQYEFLARNKCEQAQGYFFSRPLSSEDFEKLICQEQLLGTAYH